jgi:hypothetical protein
MGVTATVTWGIMNVKRYANVAEKQRAYRVRKAERERVLEGLYVKMPVVERPRWGAGVAKYVPPVKEAG